MNVNLHTCDISAKGRV